MRDLTLQILVGEATFAFEEPFAKCVELLHVLFNFWGYNSVDRSFLSVAINIKESRRGSQTPLADDDRLFRPFIGNFPFRYEKLIRQHSKFRFDCGICPHMRAAVRKKNNDLKSATQVGSQNISTQIRYFFRSCWSIWFALYFGMYTFPHDWKWQYIIPCVYAYNQCQQLSLS